MQTTISSPNSLPAKLKPLKDGSLKFSSTCLSLCVFLKASHLTLTSQMNRSAEINRHPEKETEKET